MVVGPWARQRGGVLHAQGPPRSSWQLVEGALPELMPEAPVLMVRGDLDQVESGLAGGRLRCPSCDERLARWGRARGRLRWRAGANEIDDVSTDDHGVAATDLRVRLAAEWPEASPTRMCSMPT